MTSPNASTPNRTNTDFVAGIPKAELHVHLVGSAPYETVLELAQRHPDRGVPTDPEELRSFYEFRDFAHFIEVYIAVNSLVRTAADIERLITGIAGDLARQNARYAELTVTPDSHLSVGIDPPDIAAALDNARQAARSEYGVELGWVFDIPGELGLPAGERTIDWVERYAPTGSVGFGLGGPESGVGRPQFADVFARARAVGLHCVPHAGESTGPETIWDALTELRAERIGHGIAAAGDPQLLDHLVEHAIPLEVCPTSNVRTRAVESLEAHPFPQLRDAGVTLTVNTDDPGMFDTSLIDEYRVAGDVFGLDHRELAELAGTAVRVSYAEPELKRRLLDEIRDYVEGFESSVAG